MRFVLVLALIGCGAPTQGPRPDRDPTDPTPQPSPAPRVRGPGVSASSATEVLRPPSQLIVDSAPVAFDFGDACGGVVQMCDQAEAAGLHALPPANGRGATLVDVDGDGWDDIWQAVDRGDDIPDGRSSTLWHNEQDGSFTAMDLGIAPEHLGSNWSGVWADYDNDGDPDLFLVNGGFGLPGRTWLYRNDLATTGSMTEVSDSAGILPDVRHWWGASFADYDNDGHLDLVVSALHAADPNLGPALAEGIALYHSNGDGTFTEVSEAVGLHDPLGDNKNPAWFDYGDDGDMDLFVGNFGTAPGDAHLGTPTFFRNDGPAGFVDASVDLMGVPDEFRPVFSVAASDFNQDGIDDLYLGRWSQQDKIMLMRADGSWTVVSQNRGLDMAIGMEGPIENTMGLGIGDFHGDGYPDVVIGTGAPPHQAPAIFLCHKGPGTDFCRCDDTIFHAPPVIQNHGAATGDLDHDGDDELFFNHGGSWVYDRDMGTDSRGDPTLWVNHDAPRNTVAIKLRGTVSNRDAVGARMVVAGSEIHHYRVRSAQGFQSQNSAWQTVTLGDDTQGTVVVYWPSGVIHAFDVQAGTRVEAVE